MTSQPPTGPPSGPLSPPPPPGPGPRPGPEPEPEPEPGDGSGRGPSGLLAETVVRKNCTLAAKPNRTGTLAALGRRSRKAAPYENGLSQIRVYADTATAKKFLTDGKARWKDIRETTPPDLPGFDDLVSEQGALVRYNDGSAADIRYVLLTGRTGATVMTSYLSGPPEVVQQIHQGAEDALALMRSRLPQR